MNAVREDRKAKLMAEIMEYPKETIVRAFMNVTFYNVDQLAGELLFAERKRQSEMLSAEHKRFAKIPPDQFTKRRWEYHCRKTETIQARLDDLDKKINAQLGIVKGENGSA